MSRLKFIPPNQVFRDSRRLGRPRRGVASTLAMMFLVLFSTLAVGFYAAFSLSTQVSYNERNSRRALAAAESGMEFIRFHLWALNIPHDTPADQLFDRVYNQLSGQLNGTANLKGGSIARSGDVILIPGNPNQFIDLGTDGEGFRITLVREGKEIVVRATGRNSASSAAATAGRAIRMRYGIFERPSSIFDYGVASKSSITMIGNTMILGSPDPAAGSVLSTASVDYPLTMGNTSEISGEVSFSNPDAWVLAGANSVINNEVGEVNWKDNVHHVPEPDFPVVDTSDFASYATTTMSLKSPPKATYANIVIPANTNPTFAAGTEIQGVMYVQAPNQVKFAGHAIINGIIVVENNPSGSWTSNKIEFQGTVTAQGTAALPTSDPRFAGLQDMGGAFILAPNFAVEFSGTADAGATQVTGSVVASRINFSGSATATIEGSMINLEPTSSVHFSGNGAVTVRSSGTNQQPHGLFFGSRYVPLPGSYEETTP